MGLDLEGAGPAVAYVDDAGILAGALDHRSRSRRASALGGKAAEMHARALVGAVLGPHDGEDAELGEGGGAAQSLLHASVLVRGDAVLFQKRGRDAAGGGSSLD